MWAAFITAVAVLIAAIAATAIFTPKLFTDRMNSLDLPSRIWVLASIRFLMGAGLWIVAPDTEHPRIFQVLGAITIAAAIALPLLGADRIQKIVEWWMRRPPAVLRAWGVLAMGFALFLLWSLHSG